MRRVVLFGPRFHTNLRYWVEGIRQNGFAPHVWTLYAGQSESHDTVAPDQIGYSRVWRAVFRRRSLDPYDAFSMRWGLPSLRKLWRALRTEPKPAVVIIRNVNSTPALVVLALTVLGSRAKIVLYSQGPKYRATLSLRRRVAYSVAARALGAVWLTPVRGQPSAMATHRDVYYVPFGHPPRVDAAEVLRRPCAPPRVLVVGKFMPRKNHRLFLQAFAEARKRLAMRALIVGEASQAAQRECYATLREFVAQAGLQDDVEFRLNLPPDAMGTAYREADLFVLPATAERAGFVVLEAMAFGLPVICSATNGLACYIKPGASGDVFVDGDEAQLQAALERWCQDPGGLRRGGIAALELVRARHDPHRFGEFIREVATGKLRAGRTGQRESSRGYRTELPRDGAGG